MLSASAMDDQGVAQVEFFANSNSVGIDTDGLDGWHVDWSTTNAGSYNLTAVATDILGASTTSSAINITVEDLQLSPPTADFIADVNSGTSPLPVMFDASSSSDTGGNNNGIALYHWDFDNDGSIETSTADPITSYTFTQSGVYDVTLTVEDIDGQTDQVSYQVAVLPGIRVGYVGPTTGSQFGGSMELSDGTLLIGGSALNLSWLPGGTPLTAAPDPGGLGDSNNRVAFLMHVSADLSSILHVWHLPAGVTSNIQRIRSTNVPGDPTGVVYVSGPINGGYFIGRLNGNFVDAVPAGFAWVVPIPANEEHSEAQPWDVGSNEILVHESRTSSQNAIRFRDASGNPIVMPDLRASHLVASVQTKGIGSDLSGATESYIELPLDMQSWTEAERTLIQPDGNGSLKMGTWPMDIFITEKKDGSGDPDHFTFGGQFYDLVFSVGT